MGLSRLLMANSPFDQFLLFAIFLASFWLLELFLVHLTASNPPWPILMALAGMGAAFLNGRSRRFLSKQVDFVHRSYLTLNRDLTGLALLIRVRLDMGRRMRQNQGIHEIFLENTTGKSYTFGQFNSLANCFANYFRAKGYGHGDVMALFMENCAEFVAAWIGLAKIGVVTAWINSNLRMESLAHCLRVSECKAIICSESLQKTLDLAKSNGLLADLENVHQFVLGPKTNPHSLGAIFAQENAKLTVEPEKECRVNFRSLLCFIYTSGTTGMPKPACIKHFRYYSMVTGCADSFGLEASDRLYISMPLYHTAAGIIGIGQVLLRGSSCAIRQRFSASNFWRDCIEFECTASQYIGEICRYLLAQPYSEAEKAHRVRLMFGNGLRAEIWKEFVDRFGVKIGEVYGSTEGTSNLVNIDGKIGACGFLPISPITKLVHPVRLVKVDENGQIIRKENGLAESCSPGQTGAMVSSIRHDNPLLVFDGYLNKAETNKKVIHNVFRQGDSAFLTGDILHWDRLGYLYFRIRTGDTFRFKGENVSTAEVEAVLLPLKMIIDAVVYGIRVEGVEGSVGMAALVKNKEAGRDQEFLDQLSSRLRDALPPYALPRFVRLCSAVDRTGTFKLVKTNLKRLALSRPNGDERLFIFDPALRKFIPLEEELRERLEKGEMDERELGRIFA